jgi:hypothetical protein
MCLGILHVWSYFFAAQMQSAIWNSVLKYKMQGNDETHYYFYIARIGLKLNYQSILKHSDGKKYDCNKTFKILQINSDIIRHSNLGDHYIIITMAQMSQIAKYLAKYPSKNGKKNPTCHNANIKNSSDRHF